MRALPVYLREENLVVGLPPEPLAQSFSHPVDCGSVEYHTVECGYVLRHWTIPTARRRVL